MGETDSFDPIRGFLIALLGLVGTVLALCFIAICAWLWQNRSKRPKVSGESSPQKEELEEGSRDPADYWKPKGWKPPWLQDSDGDPTNDTSPTEQNPHG